MEFSSCVRIGEYKCPQRRIIPVEGIIAVFLTHHCIKCFSIKLFSFLNLPYYKLKILIKAILNLG